MFSDFSSVVDSSSGGGVVSSGSGDSTGGVVSMDGVIVSTFLVEVYMYIKIKRSKHIMKLYK